MKLAPTFLKVSESNTVTLADLKVSGYEPPAWEKRGSDKKEKNYGGCIVNKFVAAKLTTAGTEEKSYTWLDYFNLYPASSTAEYRFYGIIHSLSTWCTFRQRRKHAW